MQPSPLVRYTMDGLKRCYMPERGLWSFKYHLDGRAQKNEARAEYDVFYSLNVLLGLSKVGEAARTAFGLSPKAMFENVAAQLPGAGARRYAYGMALWTAAELGACAPEEVVRQVDRMTSGDRAMESWTAQDVGLFLSGAAAQARRDAAWTGRARAGPDHILHRLASESGLFRDCAVGPRRLFASFATEIYCALGLYHHHETFGDPEAARAADACVAKLIALQGPQGEWPWFYHAPSGRVVDFYEVYSVHQHGMAPALLKLAMKRGVPEAREALARGFRWIFGDNELGAPMLAPEASVIARSQARRGMAASRPARLARAAFAAATGRDARLAGPGHLLVTPEVRSYELGWTLWSFGDDADFPELTHHQAFAVAAPLGAERERAFAPAAREGRAAPEWADMPNAL